MSDTAPEQPIVTEDLEQIEQIEPVQPKPGPGIQLAAQREARSWTIEQVAHQLNLAPRQILALEADNHAALPGLASVRGFIRSYAKLLKIDAEPLLEAITSNVTVVASEAAPMRRALPASYSDDTRLPSMSGYGTPSKSVIAVVAIAVLLAGGYLVYRAGWFATLSQGFSLPEPQATPGPVPAQGVEEAVPEKNDAPNELVNARGNPVSTPAVASMTNVAGAAAVPSPQANAAKGTAAAAPSVPANAQPVAVVDGKDKLILKFRATSWVEIKRPGTNGLLISRLVEAGSSEAFDMTGPVSMVIGNAAGVDVSLRGATVDIKSSVINNVARLNLK